MGEKFDYPQLKIRKDVLHCFQGVLDFGSLYGPWALNVAIRKKSLPILDTHWHAVSRLMVASGHGSDNVDRQCSSSDVSCGGTVGSSCGYLRDSSMPLLRVASGSDSPAIKKVNARLAS